MAMVGYYSGTAFCFLQCTYFIRSFLERQEICPRPQIGGRATATARRTCRCRAGRPPGAATSQCPPTPAYSTAASSSTGSSIRFVPFSDKRYRTVSSHTGLQYCSQQLNRLLYQVCTFFQIEGIVSVLWVDPQWFQCGSTQCGSGKF
jgi:hypothetical protein